MKTFFCKAILSWLLLATACTAGTPATSQPVEASLFSTSNQCAACHDNLQDQNNNDISYVGLWKSSMHANASRDPYFLATVRHEGISYPTHKGAIEDTCSACHLPMARLTAEVSDLPTSFLDDGSSNLDNPLHPLYREGVSCLVCHQIRPDGLGDSASYSGGYRIDTKSPPGERILYGPFGLDTKMQTIMQSATQFIVQKSDHMAKAEFCAVCHTLYTSPVTSDGKPSDIQFPEQVPYLEWQQSDWADNATCQTCHMPPSSGAGKISNLSDQPRSPVHPHAFPGGNAYMLSLLKNNDRGRGNAANPEQFEGAIQRNRDLLQTQTATLTVSASQSGDVLDLKVGIANLTGHKLPTAFPSRRVWLHVVVKDANNQILFESGGWQADGAITGNDNDQDATRFEPHYTVIQLPDQVQIYEAILVDLDGRLTTGIIHAAGYLKDNRLLPAGFDKHKAHADTAVAGEALNDESFNGGQDEISYQVSLQDASGPLSVRVELAYQSIGYRWLQNLTDVKTGELEALLRMTSTTPNTPIILTVQELEVKY